MDQQNNKNSSESNRLFPTWFWLMSLGLVFFFSVIWHLPIAPFLKNAQTVLPDSIKNLSFDNAEGGFLQGGTQLSWQFDGQQEPLSLGHVQWQQPPGELLSSLNPKIIWQTQFGQWQGDIERSWLQESIVLNTATLQIDIQDFLSWLAPFARVPFEVKGDLSSKQLMFDWSPKHLLTALEGEVVMEGLTTMGVSMPPLRLQASMPDPATQQVQWQLSGQADGWTLQGSGTLQAKPRTTNFGDYQGKLLVTAQTAEQLPDFAHLFRAVSATSAELAFNGNLQQYRK